jgi:GNAT superfamily N-acetyltransferase
MRLTIGVMSEPDIVIRPVSRDDFHAWAALWRGYNEFYGRDRDTALPDSVTRATWSHLFDPDVPVHALVADRGGVVVGIVHFVFHHSTIQIAPTCYLADLFTAEAARGAGVGRALIEAVGERAAESGSPSVYWHTHETNATARRLYDLVAERSGFIVYKRPT